MSNNDYDYTHTRTVFTRVKSETVNGPFVSVSEEMPPRRRCYDLEEAYSKMAMSAGGCNRVDKCNHCGEEFDGTPGRSILYHLDKEHGIKHPNKPPYHLDFV